MNSPARTEILARIRRANEAALGEGGRVKAPAVDGTGSGSTPAAAAEEVERDVRPEAAQPAGAELVDLFVERAADYRAEVHRARPGEVKDRVESICARNQARSLVVPSDFPVDWVPDGVEVIADGPTVSVEALDASGGVLTTCRLAVAVTGSVVLDAGPGQGRRAATLVPDLHICVIEADDLVFGVEEAFVELADAPAAGRPVTFISGPSATSDIELSRVEGVHGPRNLELIICERG